MRGEVLLDLLKILLQCACFAFWPALWSTLWCGVEGGGGVRGVLT